MQMTGRFEQSLSNLRRSVADRCLIFESMREVVEVVVSAIWGNAVVEGERLTRANREQPWLGVPVPRTPAPAEGAYSSLLIGRPSIIWRPVHAHLQGCTALANQGLCRARCCSARREAPTLHLDRSEDDKIHLADNVGAVFGVSGRIRY